MNQLNMGLSLIFIQDVNTKKDCKNKKTKIGIIKVL